LRGLFKRTMFKNNNKYYIEKIKELHGDPHYVSLGMAIGVFIGITPTIPFHTIIAVALAVRLKASKPAAILGVWVSNPMTVVFLYFACYKTGFLFFENTTGAFESIERLIHHLESDIRLSEKVSYFNGFIKTQARMFLVMNFGGLLLGLPSGLITYIITKGFFTRLRGNKKLRDEEGSK